MIFVYQGESLVPTSFVLFATPIAATLTSYLFEQSEVVLERMLRVVIRRGQTLEAHRDIADGIFGNSSLGVFPNPPASPTQSLPDLIVFSFRGVQLAWLLLWAVALANIVGTVLS